MRHVEKGLVCVEHHRNACPWRNSQLANQVVILRFECAKNFASQRLGRLTALEPQGEVAAFALRKLGFRLRFPLGLCQQFFYTRVGSKLQRLLPRAYRSEEHTSELQS